MTSLAFPSPTSPARRRIRGVGIFRHDVWNVGIVEQTAADIVAHGLAKPVRWLPHPDAWTFWADPSCRRRPDGGLDLFAERMDYWADRGEIWTAEVPCGGDPTQAKFYPMISKGVHLSYPFPFVDDEGRACLTAESWQAKGAFLWRESAEGWSCTGKLFDGRPVIDPTLWRDGDRWWLFCTFQDDQPARNLHLFHAPSAGGPWTPHRANPVVVDTGSARPGGPLFWADGVLVRPSQDNSVTYGGALMLNAVTRLDLDGYREEPIRRLSPVAPYSAGLHTLYPAGDCTLVDGKCRNYHPLEVVRKAIVTFRHLISPPRDRLS